MFWSFLIVALLPPNPWILDHEFFPIIWESGKDGIFEPFFWWGWLSRYVPKMLKSHICETLHQIAKTKPRYLPWISRFQAKNMTDFSTPNLVEVLFFFRWFWERQRCDGMYQLGIKGFGLQQCTSVVESWKLVIPVRCWGRWCQKIPEKKQGSWNSEMGPIFWGEKSNLISKIGHCKFLEGFRFFLRTRCLKQSFVVFYPGTLFSSSIILEFSWFTWYAWSKCFLFLHFIHACWWLNSI